MRCDKPVDFSGLRIGANIRARSPPQGRAIPKGSPLVIWFSSPGLPTRDWVRTWVGSNLAVVPSKACSKGLGVPERNLVAGCLHIVDGRTLALGVHVGSSSGRPALPASQASPSPQSQSGPLTC